MLNVPFYKQDTNYTCGPTALQMVFAYYGVRVSEKELTERLDTETSTGTKHEPMIEIAREEGFFVYVNNHASLEEVGYILGLNIPVIVHYIEPSSEEGHYAVAVDLTDENILLNDSWNGEQFTIAREDFIRRWRDDKGEAMQWLLAISPEQFSVGKQYYPE